MKKQKCHDCGVFEGEYHKENCDMEICPKCKGQLLSCDCDFVNIKKREPYFLKGLSCERCGKYFPTLKTISNKSWKKICGITYHTNNILCSNCMDFILKLRNKHGKSKYKK